MKPVAAVYMEAAQAIIRYDQGLKLLASVIESSGWEWGLPSWVPNFSGCIRKWSPSNPPRIAIAGQGNPAVSGHTEWQYEFMLDGQALRVRGRRLDLVCASGLPWMTDASKNMMGDSPRQTGQVISSFVESVISWLDVVQGQGDCQDTEAAMTLLARTLLHASPKPVHLSAEAVDRVVSVVLRPSFANNSYSYSFAFSNLSNSYIYRSVIYNNSPWSVSYKIGSESILRSIDYIYSPIL